MYSQRRTTLSLGSVIFQNHTVTGEGTYSRMNRCYTLRNSSIPSCQGYWRARKLQIVNSFLPLYSEFVWSFFIRATTAERVSSSVDIPYHLGSEGYLCAWITLSTYLQLNLSYPEEPTHLRPAHTSTTSRSWPPRCGYKGKCHWHVPCNCRSGLRSSIWVKYNSRICLELGIDDVEEQYGTRYAFCGSFRNCLRE